MLNLTDEFQEQKVGKLSKTFNPFSKALTPKQTVGLVKYFNQFLLRMLNSWWGVEFRPFMNKAEQSVLRQQ